MTQRTEHNKLSKYNETKICSNFTALHCLSHSRFGYCFARGFVRLCSTSANTHRVKYNAKTSYSQKIESKTQKRKIGYHVIAI